MRHYEDMGLKITSQMSDAPVSHKNASSRVESAAVGFLDVVDTIQGKLRAYSSIIDDAEKTIDKIPNERYRMILKLHWLAGMSLPSVGDEVGYKDRNSIYRAHGWALLELEHVLQNDGMGE